MVKTSPKGTRNLIHPPDRKLMQFVTYSFPFTFIFFYSLCAWQNLVLRHFSQLCCARHGQSIQRLTLKLLQSSHPLLVYEDLKAMMKCERQKEEPGEMIQRHAVNSILKKVSISQNQVIWASSAVRFKWCFVFVFKTVISSMLPRHYLTGVKVCWRRLLRKD